MTGESDTRQPCVLCISCRRRPGKEAGGGRARRKRSTCPSGSAAPRTRRRSFAISAGAVARKCHYDQWTCVCVCVCVCACVCVCVCGGGEYGFIGPTVFHKKQRKAQVLKHGKLLRVQRRSFSALGQAALRPSAGASPALVRLWAFVSTAQASHPTSASASGDALTHRTTPRVHATTRPSALVP